MQSHISQDWGVNIFGGGRSSAIRKGAEITEIVEMVVCVCTHAHVCVCRPVCVTGSGAGSASRLKSH